MKIDQKKSKNISEFLMRLNGIRVRQCVGGVWGWECSRKEVSSYKKVLIQSHM